MSDKCEARNRPQMLAINKTLKTAIVFRPRCKRWGCPYCGQQNKRLWVMRIYAGAEALRDDGSPLDFVTLTSHEKLSATQSWHIWPRAWNKLQARAHRAQPGAAYVLVPEQHADGRIHVHMVTTWQLGARWWKDNARACGLGYMVDDTPVRSPAGAAWYVGKYIAKQLVINAWPGGFRRVRTGARWPKSPALPRPDGWHFHAVPDGDPLSHYTGILDGSLGYRLWWADHKQAWEIISEYDSGGHED